MNAIQESKLNMYRSVQLLCKSNNSIVADNVAFSQGLSQLDALITNITNYLSLEIKHTAGITEDKTKAKDNLSALAADIAGLVFAYADTIQNKVLKDEVKYSYSELKRLREDVIVPTVSNIYKAAFDNLSVLTDFGVNAQLLAQLEEAMETYNAVLPKGKTTKSEKSSFSANISNSINEIDDLLKNRLDKLVIVFNKTNPDFVKAYKKVRQIDAPNTVTTQLKGKVISSSDGKLIQGAEISISGETTMSTQSDKDGLFGIKPLKAGIYQINVQATGYQTSTIVGFQVKMGKINRVEVQLKE